jgi:hypothetical protein
MSFDNAITVRSKMNATYKQMLGAITDPIRREAIEKQIKLNLEEIETLRKEQLKIFGKTTPLVQPTTIIEPDIETKGQKVTVLNAPKISLVENTIIPSAEELPIPTPTPKRLGNSLRDTLKAKHAALAEASLKAKILAAKAAKKTS